MKNLTTLGKVWDRVDELNRYCHDNLIDVADISFDSLETMKIGNDHHNLKNIAQRSIAWRLGSPGKERYIFIKSEKHNSFFLYTTTSGEKWMTILTNPTTTGDLFCLK